MAIKDRIARYHAYNQSRILKAISFDTKKSTILFKIIPFLLHANSPDLPGYVDDPNCPYGIYGLKPLKLVDADLFSRYFATSQALRAGADSPFAKQPIIHSLKTIGSIGTIAQAEKSDCDYWLSVKNAELGDKGLALLGKKCDGIMEWAMKKGVEVYFFPMDIDQTRENSFEAETDQESAGSAIKILLKDELFRTHILVAGKMLLWWLIPPGFSEQGYRAYVQKMVTQQAIKPDSFVDLGYMSDIPKAEIFGACLWQMNKAYDSPFKSVIKLAYLDMLLNQSKTQALLWFSDKVKCLVTFPEKKEQVSKTAIELTEVDPYLLMAQGIVNFYLPKLEQPESNDQMMAKGRESIQQEVNKEEKYAELIRECLFLKTLEGMASAKRKPTRRKHLETIIELMKGWNLLPKDAENFSKVRSWPFQDKLGFGAKIHEFLIGTYTKLQENAGLYDVDHTITQRDLAVLGRKLFTFYEKKANKIDYIQNHSCSSKINYFLFLYV